MKILILSCNTGEGHNSAAKAIAEELDRRGVESEIRDALAFVSEQFSHNICTAYIKMALRVPALMGATYKLAEKVGDGAPNHRSLIYEINRFYAPKVYEYLEETKPDAVIMTHLFAGEVMSAVRKKYGCRIPSYIVSTDYDYCPCFGELDVDRYFIPHKHLTYQFTDRKIPEEKISATGIPISARFFSRVPKNEARAKLGLSTFLRYALIMTGSMGYGDTRELVKQLLRETPEDVCCIVMGGKNSKLKSELRKAYGTERRVIVLDFTKEVSLYMDACDLLLTKPGGLSTTEAAAHGIPLVHTKPIPGCESDNLYFFVNHGMSVSGETPRTAALHAAALLDDKQARERMMEAQRQYINAASAYDLCSVVLSDLAEKS